MVFKELLISDLVKSFSGSFIIRVLSIISTFMASVVLARVLGPEQFGIYSYVFAIITLLALPAMFGLPTLIIRETATGVALKHWGRVKGVWQWSAAMIACTSTVIMFLGLFVVWVLPNKLSQDYTATLMVGFVLVPLLALGNARGAALRGLKKVIQGQLPESVIRPFLLALLVFIISSLGKNVTAESAMSTHVVASAIAFLIGAGMLFFSRPSEVIEAKRDTSESYTWLRSMVPLAVIASMQNISKQTDILMLGLYVDPVQIGIYKVVVSGASLGLFGLQVVNIVLGPRIAYLYANKNLKELQRIVKIGVAISIIVTAPFALAIWFYGDWILALIFGVEYTSGYTPFSILVTGQLVNASFGAVGLLLNMSGYEKDSMKWFALSTVVNVVLNAMLIPMFGLEGAAVSTAVSISLWNVLFWRAALKRIGVDSSLRSLLKFKARDE